MATLGDGLATKIKRRESVNREPARAREVYLCRMNPTSSLYSTLAYRYGLSLGNSYAAEIFAIVVWSRCVIACELGRV